METGDESDNKAMRAKAMRAKAMRAKAMRARAIGARAATSNVRGGSGGDDDDDDDDADDDDDEEQEQEQGGGGDNDGDAGQGEGSGDAIGTTVAARQPSNSDARVSVPIRLREVEEADYYMKDALMSVEQADWATERMGSAHECFIEHMSSRMGYGEVMLMQPPLLDPTAVVPRPTGGEIANAKMDAAQAWNALLADERTKELAQLLQSAIADIDKDLAVTSENAIQWRATIKDDSNSQQGSGSQEEERTHAVEGLLDHQGNIKLQLGYRQAMRLATRVNAFRNHEAGGLIALFAWWHRLNEDLDRSGVPENARADKLIDAGGKLCEKYSDVHSSNAAWVPQKTKKFWRGMWAFMEKVDLWLDRNAPDGMREQVNELAADTAFAGATDWPALMSNS